MNGLKAKRYTPLSPIVASAACSSIVKLTYCMVTRCECLTAIVMFTLCISLLTAHVANFLRTLQSRFIPAQYGDIDLVHPRHEVSCHGAQAAI